MTFHASAAGKQQPWEHSFGYCGQGLSALAANSQAATLRERRPDLAVRIVLLTDTFPFVEARIHRANVLRTRKGILR